MARRRPTPQRLPEAVREAVERTIQSTLGGAAQTRGRAQEALDDVVHGAEAGAKNVRKRAREAVEATVPATSADIRELRDEIKRLEKRVKELEGKKPASKPAGRGPRAAGQPEPVRPKEPFSRWSHGRHSGQLLALLRMAVGGVTREQLEHELDAALPPDEREALLDDVFGAPEKARQRDDSNGSQGVPAATEPA
jgi:hypothetical protein